MEESDSGWTIISKKRKSPHFPKPKRKKNIQKEISADELIKLKDIISSQSSLFQMQIDDLLTELAQDKEAIELWINQFKKFVVEIPESSQNTIKEFSVGKKIKIPIDLIPDDDKGFFKFAPPSKVIEIGSYFYDSICSSTPIIDIAVEIPKACWRGMDHLNYRYHRKRALYLAYIAKSLLKTDLTSNIEFCYQNDSDIKPNLLITPQGTSNFTFCLTAFPCEEAFKECRFYSDKINIRASWLCNDPDAIDEPTPLYNCTVLVDILLVKLNTYLKEKLSSQSLKEAVILLKIWAFQRGLTNGYGRLNGFILSLFMVSLLDKKRISVHMNNYEIFKCAILELSIASLSTAFFEEVTKFDVLYSVNEEALLMVKHEAKIALDMLNNMSSNTFHNLFMKKITFLEKFEYFMHLKEINLELLPEICEKLKKGLGKRILLLDIDKKSARSWSIFSPSPNSNKSLITIGFLLNPEVPFSNLEKGPVANDPEAKVFREFWGNQSELRRFQDGTIREAVFWPASTIAEKREVFCIMCKDILERHFKFVREDVDIHGGEIESALQVPDIILSKDFPSYGTGEEAHSQLIQSFDLLTKQLRALKLPLQISSVQGISSALRYSEVFPPLSVLHRIDASKCYIDGHSMKIKDKSMGVPPYTPVLKAIVQLEGSGKWPEDVEALQRVKAAFYLKIAELVQSQCSLMALPFVKHVDIFKDGYVFRIEIACHKEVFLMKQVKAPDGTIKFKESKEAQCLEVSTQILPKLNGVLHGLHQQHSSYGTACRLAKRWIAAQLKHGFIEDIIVELIVAHIYLHPEPYTHPCSPQVAFCRFLSLLIAHNWGAAPLIINLNNEFTAENIEEINLIFTSQRSTLPAMVIVTPYDKRGNIWTKNKPPEVILKRIILLAEASLDTLSNYFLDLKFVDIMDIFRPPLYSFDVIIHLKRKEIPTLRCAVDVRKDDPLPLYSPYEYKANELYPIVDYNPVLNYLEELKVNFSDWAVFLNDPYGGDLIAVKWKSIAFKNENAKIHHGCKIIPNVEEILENFRILGEGLVEDIECKIENWQLP